LLREASALRRNKISYRARDSINNQNTVNVDTTSSTPKFFRLRLD